MAHDVKPLPNINLLRKLRKQIAVELGHDAEPRIPSAEDLGPISLYAAQQRRHDEELELAERGDPAAARRLVWMLSAYIRRGEPIPEHLRDYYIRALAGPSLDVGFRLRRTGKRGRSRFVEKKRQRTQGILIAYLLGRGVSEGEALERVLQITGQRSANALRRVWLKQRAAILEEFARYPVRYPNWEALHECDRLIFEMGNLAEY